MVTGISNTCQQANANSVKSEDWSKDLQIQASEERHWNRNWVSKAVSEVNKFLIRFTGITAASAWILGSTEINLFF